MITAVLIDDEKHLRDGMKRLLELYGQEISIVGEAESVKTGILALEKYNPQVVFLDINLTVEKRKNNFSNYFYYCSRAICPQGF
jgi:two-component system, LytTR family, response regulator